MTAQPTGHLMCADIDVFAYDLTGDQYRVVADSDTELVLEKPFPIRLPIADITP